MATGTSLLRDLGFTPHSFSFPSAVERKDLMRLRRGYVVADKSDGTRYLLAVSGKTQMLIGRNLEGMPVHVESNVTDCYAMRDDAQFLLDGELVALKKDATTKMFVVYDALKTSRGPVHHLGFDVRRAELESDFFNAGSNILALPNGKKVAMLLKKVVPMDRGLEFYHKDVPRLPYSSDGLIFTPVDAPIVFGTCKNLFKWKILEANTVDFRIVGDGHGYVLSLIDHGREVVIGRTSLREGSLIKMLVDMDLRNGLQPIYECVWDHSNNSWQPRKSRKDKSEPNSIMTFRATVRNLEENVTLRDLFVE
jgi:hypothetical protein